MIIISSEQFLQIKLIYRLYINCLTIKFFKMKNSEKKAELIKRLLDKKFGKNATIKDNCDSCGEKCSD